MSNRGAGMQLRTGGGWRSAGRVLLAVAVLAAAGAASAVDVPHDSSNLIQPACKDCHQLHFAPLPNLQGTDCVSCHTTRGFTSWLGSDQAVAGSATTGSSHNWSAAPTSVAAGAALPTNAAMRTRVTEAGTLTCGACHDPHSQTNVPFDPAASQTPGHPGRHFMLVSNGASEMCLDCHAAWAQSTEASRMWTNSARSHPVVSKDAAGTTPLTLANAGSGGGSDWSYRQTPHDSGLRATVQAGSTASLLNLEPSFKLATNALANFAVRFTSGPYRNVQARISLSGTSSVTLAVALPGVPATGTTLEIDRAGSMIPYDVTANAGAVANQIQDLSKSWATAGNNSPFGGAGTVTILSTTASSGPDVGKVCTIASNTATTLTLQAGCLTAIPTNGAWAYRINWKLGGAGTTTGGTTTTFLDPTKTLWNNDSIAGLQVRFLPGNQVARITVWNLGTGTATFTPARATPVAAGEEYVLEPAQVQAPVVAASSGTTTSLSVLGTPWTGLSLKGLLVRFTRTQNAAIQGMVTRITASTAASLSFVALPAAVRLGDTFEIDLDGNVSNNIGLGGATGSYAAGKVVCQSCHGVHYADSNATTYDDAPRAGDGNLLRRAANDDTCDACHATGMHNSVTTDSSHGTWGMTFTCGTCHQPHGTKNIYLVKEQIVTPGGPRAVDFRTASGAAVNGLASPTGVPGVEVCNVCHTQTSRSRYNVATDWSGHYDGNACTTCHTHQGGFAGAESKGAVECTNCHDYGMRVADAARTGTYHHVMEQGLTLTGASATAYPTNATPVTDGVTDKTCVQCHVDHNLFRPDMNTSIGTNGRGNNLRTRIGSAPPAAANKVPVIAAPNDTSTFFGNTDYLAGTPGGICMSCHTSAQTKDRTNQAPGDTKTQTATLTTADFAASAHAYTVAGVITNGAPNSGFTVACTKCHNSDTTPAYQSGANGRRFALHTSADRRLRAPLGQTPLLDDRGEAFCYRCHSTTANAAALGGATKSAANYDWYGAVTTMSAASQDVYNQMQKGTAGTAPAPTSSAAILNFKPLGEDTPSVVPAGTIVAAPTAATNTLYLKGNADDKYMGAATLPAAYRLASGTYSGTTNYNRRVLSTVAGTNEDGRQQTTVATANSYYRVAQFVSAPFAQTASWASGSIFTLNLGTRENLATQNAYPQFALYKFTPSSNTWTRLTCTGGTGTCLASGTEFVARSATEAGNNLANTRFNTHSVAFTTNAAASFAVGDMLVVELEFIQTAAVIGNVQAYWGNATTNARLVLPGTVSFQPDTVAGGGFATRGMTPSTPSTANETFNATTLSVGQGASALTGTAPNAYGNPTTQYWSRVAFVSPPVVAGGSTVAAGTWTLNLFALGTNNTSPRVRYLIYRMDSAGNNVGTIVARTADATAINTTSTAVAINAAGVPAISFAAGERVVVDLQLLTNAVTVPSATATLQYVFGSTSVARLTMPGAATFDYASSGSPASGRHDVGTYAGVHSPLETGADIAASKHVECEDCHEPHAAKAGLHAQGSNVAGAVLTGAPMVTPTFSGTNWQTNATVVVTYAQGTVGATSPEAYVCFRCHSNYNTAIPNSPATPASAPWNTGGGGFTNQAIEFSTSNASYHPVLGGLPLTDPGANGSSRLNATQLVGTDHTWTPGQTMTCTDCHNADAGSPAAQGPHGSAVTYMLAGTNKAWPYTTAGATSGTLRRIGSGNNSETGLNTADGLFCRNCHPVPDGATSNTVHDTFVGISGEHISGANDYFACVSCHIRVPHGGKVGRLILTPNAPARYKVTGAGTTVGITMANFTKQAYRAYTNVNFFDSNGCVEHANITTGEAW